MIPLLSQQISKNMSLLPRHGKARFDPAQVWTEFGLKNLAWVHHGWPLPRWNLGTATAVEFQVWFNTSGKYHIWIYDIIFIDIHLYRPNLSYLFYSMLCVAARGPSCGAFAGSLGDTSTISWQRRWIWSNGWHPNGWFLWNHHGLYGILWICMEKTSWNITYLKQ